MTLIGYARVSTADQTTALQLDALKQAGCDQVYRDEATSGSTTARPGLDRALKALHAGDTLMVWRLDRLGRSLAHLIETVTGLRERGVAFRSLTEALDTTSAAGELIFHVFGAMAHFERRLIVERTRAGLDAAKRRGTKLGPRFRLDGAKVAHARKLIADGEGPGSVARTFGVDRATLYRALAREP